MRQPTSAFIAAARHERALIHREIAAKQVIADSLHARFRAAVAEVKKLKERDARIAAFVPGKPDDLGYCTHCRAEVILTDSGACAACGGRRITDGPPSEGGESLRRQPRQRTYVDPVADPEDAELVAFLIEQHAAAYGVTPQQVLGRSRHAGAVNARHAVMCDLRDDGWSLPRIGSAVGRDHTTVFYALQKAASA